METYAKFIHYIVKKELEGFDAIYEDYIINLVGYAGLKYLKEYKLIETCGIVNGRQLYTLCDLKGE